jgi:fatty acid desaturase
MLVFGLAQVALFAPHTGDTQTASPHAGEPDRRAGGMPSRSICIYTAFHFAHHRHDADSARIELEMGPPNDGRLARSRGAAVCAGRTTTAGAVMIDTFRPLLLSEQAALAITRSVRVMSVAMIGGSAASAVLFGWATPFVYWIAPQLLCQPFLRAYVLAEHTGCTTDRNGLTNTRTTLTNGVVRLFMWNIPFHAEHHLYPSIPFHRLPDAHAAIRDKLRFVQHGYLRWNLDMMRRLANRA